MRPWLKSHQIARDLGVAALSSDQIERQRSELVDDRNGARILALIDRDEVTPAHLARVDSQVREEIEVGEDRHLRPGRLAARRARHATQHPLVRAARAHESALRREKRLARLRKHSDLRKPTASRAGSLCRIARPELGRALAALRVSRRLFGKQRHQSFSMLTRNDLNSGVRAPTSPTIGVSAFASQYFDRSGFCSAEIPTKPQWIGIPIW